jgi:hypothetical protein
LILGGGVVSRMGNKIITFVRISVFLLSFFDLRLLL